MNLATTGAWAADATPAMHPTIRHKRTRRARRVLPRSAPHGERLSLSKAQERMLLGLFLNTCGARPRTTLRVTTLASVTPWPMLRALARTGAMVVLDAPRFELVFGEPGWECILTSRGYAALRAALAREAR